MLFTECGVLQLQMLKLFILGFALASQLLSQVVNPLAYLLIHVMQVCFRLLLQLLQIGLDLRLILLL
jgi:hypothetical protein